MRIPSDSPLRFVNRKLYFDNIPLSKIADKVGTPFYLYSEETIAANFQRFLQAAHKSHINNPLVCFALKANPNLTLLKRLKKEGAGADIVSGGELTRALEAGISPQKIVFSGVGKSRKEIEQALSCHKNGIYSFNVESLEELEMINELARKKGMRARVALRLNPHVQAKTHKNISTGLKTHKFGILEKDILNALKDPKYTAHAELVGMSVHIGSQLLNLSATRDAITQLCDCVLKAGVELEFLDVGGGLGVDYAPADKKLVPTPEKYMKLVSETLKKGLAGKQNPRIVFEPGRFISARAGVFITSVIRSKTSGGNRFLIVDGGMNDFVRTSLYDAYHELIPGRQTGPRTPTTVVGPICETTDCFAKKRPLPKLESGDLLSVSDTGAYGFSMASTYNMRKLPTEVVVGKNGKLKIFRY